MVLASSSAVYSQALVPDITVIDDLTGNVLTDGQVPVVDFGCTQPGSPVSRSFTVRNDGQSNLTLRSNGLRVPAGYSISPAWPTALVTPEFKVIVQKTDSRASAVDFTRFELVTMPSILSITRITIKIPDKWIQYQPDGITPDSQTPFIDGDTNIVIQSGSSGLDLDQAPGGGWYCTTPGVQDNPNGDICVEYGGTAWRQGSQNRFLEATLRITPEKLTGTLDFPSNNETVTFGYGLAGLNPPRVRNASNDGDSFGISDVEVIVDVYNSVTMTTETVSGTFVDTATAGNFDDDISTATLFATPVLVPIPVEIPPMQTWQDVVGAPLTVQLDAVAEGAYVGDWELSNDDPDEDPFDFVITGIVDGTPPVIQNLPSNITVPVVGTACEAPVNWTPPIAVDFYDPAPTIVKTLGPDPGLIPVGVYTIQYTATDCAGNQAIGEFTVSVVDTTPPTLQGALPKRIIANTAPGDTSVIVNYPPLTAFDNCDPNPLVVCTPPSGSTFPLGLTIVTCYAEDSSGNRSPSRTFEVIVIEAQPTPSPRTPAVFAERNIPAPGIPGAVINVVRHAYMNESGQVALETTLTGAGPNDTALWKSSGAGLQLVSREGDIVPGRGLPISRYDDIVLNDAGALGFEAFLSGATTDSDAVYLSDVTGSVSLSISEGDPVAGGPALYKILHQTAFSETGESFTPVNLVLGVGGVSIANDTGIWRKLPGGALQAVAVEGLGIGGALPTLVYGQINPRVVADQSGRIAFDAFLEVGPGGVTINDNAILLSGAPGALVQVARENQAAPDSDGALFQTFAAESISDTGRVVFEANLKSGPSGTPVTSTNNTGLYTNSNGTLQLVAREGDLAPCLGATAGDFADFREIFIAENGDVFFRAYLRGGGVGSHNDGTFWRWRSSDQTLHPILREGDPAPSTQGAVFNSLVDITVSQEGMQAVTATLVPGVGDCELSNNYGLWMDNGTDGLPILQVREGDTLPLSLIPQVEITVLFLDRTTNVFGGAGGHGKVLNGQGDLIVRPSFNVNTSGALIFSNPPTP